MNGEKVLFDTNVLVHAYDSLSAKHAAASKALEQAFADRSGAVSVQNLAEFSHVAVFRAERRLSPGEVRKTVFELSSILEVVSYDAYAISDALSIWEKYGLHFFDALLAATMEKEGISAIITENEKDFQKIPWLEVINPFK